MLKIAMDSPTGNIGTHLCEGRQWMEVREVLSMRSEGGSVLWEIEQRDISLPYCVISKFVPFESVNRGTYRATVLGMQ